MSIATHATTPDRTLGECAIGDVVGVTDWSAKVRRGAARPIVRVRIVGPDPTSRNRVEVEHEDGTRTRWNVSTPVERSA